MKNIITIGLLTHVIFNPNTCTFPQSNKQEKAPLLPEIAHKKPKIENVLKKSVITEIVNNKNFSNGK